MLKPHYPIQTARLFLRPFCDRDLDDLYGYTSLPSVVKYLYGRVAGKEDAIKTLKKRKTMTVLNKEGDGLYLAVTLADSGRLIGDVVLLWKSAAHRRGELGYVFHPEFHGRGYGAEAAEAVLALGFEQLGLHRMVGRCDARNTASAKLMERLGMRREAHFIQNEWVKGEWTDELTYAMLEDEWRTRVSNGKTSG